MKERSKREKDTLEQGGRVDDRGESDVWLDVTYYFSVGRTDGLNCSRCLDDEEIQIVLKWDGKSIPSDRVFRQYVEHVLVFDDLLRMNYSRRPRQRLNIYAQSYMQGFFEGIRLANEYFIGNLN